MIVFYIAWALCTAISIGIGIAVTLYLPWLGGIVWGFAAFIVLMAYANDVLTSPPR